MPSFGVGNLEMESACFWGGLRWARGSPLPLVQSIGGCEVLSVGSMACGESAGLSPV